MNRPTDWPAAVRPAGDAGADDVTRRVTRSDSGVRIGDAERERAVTELGEHFTAGRLDRDELDDRLELAWRARTATDLSPLFTDLPRTGVDLRPVGRPAEPAGRRAWRAGPPFGFPPLLLLLVPLAIVLTIVTHAPFVLFFLWWFVIGGFFRGGFRQRAYASRR